ncbi:MAG: glycosyltransferase [Melioribacteraceae bacterium]|nr:glycosyltransferase [Melioribacteraceae bacterium]
MNNLTLSMIVKNEEKHLRGCLESVKNIVDEIVIVDTGSTDNTLKIAEEFGAKLFHFNWINDFSAARNYALRNSSGRWILYLDADERLSPESINELSEIIKKEEKTGYNCTVKSIDSENGRDNQMFYVRLFAGSKDIYFSGVVHEQILPSLVENGYQIKGSLIKIDHIGYNIDNAGKKEKAKRNLELLRVEHEKNNSPYVEFQLALTNEILENYYEAKKYFLLAALNNSLDTAYRAHCYTSLALIYNKEHNIEEAEKHLMNSLTLRKDDPFTHLLASKIYLRKNDLKTSLDHLKKAEKYNEELKEGKKNRDYSVYLNEEEILFCGLTISKKTGDQVSLKEYYRKLIDFIYTHDGQNNRLFVKVIEKVIGNNPLEPEDMYLFCKQANSKNLPIFLELLKDYNQFNSKKDLIYKLSESHPDNAEVKKLLAELYTAENNHQEAAKIYLNLAEGNSNDPSVYFYLLSFYITNGNYKKLITTVNEIESKFYNIPEVADRIKLIKTRLTEIL